MALGTETFTVDNLVSATKPIITRTGVLASGESVVRGQVLKNTAGEFTPCLTTEAPNTIALQTVDASGGAEAIEYIVEGSVLESEVAYNTGTAAEYREALRSFGIITE